MKVSNTNNFSSIAAEAYNTVKSWVLSTGDGLKTVYAWFKDTVGNWNTSSYSDSITLDTTFPTISNILSSNITTNSANISFTTNEQTTSYIEYGLTTSYGSQTQTISNLSSFTLQITGLSDNTTYHYRITSIDSANNTSQSTNQTLTTQQAVIPDTTPPSNIANLSSSNITQTSVNLSWTSPGDDNNNGTASEYDIRYSTSNITEDKWNLTAQVSGEPIPNPSGTSQSMTIVGLNASTQYYFAVKTRDEVPNWSEISNILSITTLEESTPPPVTPPSGGGGGAVSDTTPPSQPSEFTATGADKQIILTWANPTDSDFVRVKILRKEGSAPISHNDASSLIIYEGTEEEYTDIELDNNTVYHYSIFAYDKKPNYSSILTVSKQPEAGKTSIEKQQKSICFGIEVNNLFGLDSNMVECISLREAKIVGEHDQYVELDSTGKQLYQKIISAEEQANLGLNSKYSLAYFIYNYTATTKRLGAGERAGVINSYRSVFNKFPHTESGWQDVIKIANGRWPSERNDDKEQEAYKFFGKIYLREPDRSNFNDNAAVTVITYGLRPANRNMDSEKAGIRIFKAIYGYNPESAVDWDIVRAIAYSGATR